MFARLCRALPSRQRAPGDGDGAAGGIRAAAAAVCGAPTTGHARDARIAREQRAAACAADDTAGRAGRARAAAADVRGRRGAAPPARCDG